MLRVVTAQRFEVNIYKCDGIYAVFGGLYVRMYHCRVLYTMLCFRGYSLKMKDCLCSTRQHSVWLQFLQLLWSIRTKGISCLHKRLSIIVSLLLSFIVCIPFSLLSSYWNFGVKCSTSAFRALTCYRYRLLARYLAYILFRAYVKPFSAIWCHITKWDAKLLVVDRLERGTHCQTL